MAEPNLIDELIRLLGRNTAIKFILFYAPNSRASLEETCLLVKDNPLFNSDAIRLIEFFKKNLEESIEREEIRMLLLARFFAQEKSMHDWFFLINQKIWQNILYNLSEGFKEGHELISGLVKFINDIFHKINLIIDEEIAKTTEEMHEIEHEIISLVRAGLLNIDHLDLNLEEEEKDSLKIHLDKAIHEAFKNTSSENLPCENFVNAVKEKAKLVLKEVKGLGHHLSENYNKITNHINTTAATVVASKKVVNAYDSLFEKKNKFNLLHMIKYEADKVKNNALDKCDEFATQVSNKLDIRSECLAIVNGLKTDISTRLDLLGAIKSNKLKPISESLDRMLEKEERMAAIRNKK
jgi:hypothetical protein